MARYTLTGHLRPPLGKIWTDRVTLTWDDGTLTTPDPDLTQAIQIQSCLEVPVELPLPASASPPYLSWHGQSLVWLRQHIMEPGHHAEGDLVDPELLPTPDIRDGPIEQRRIVVN